MSSTAVSRFPYLPMLSGPEALQQTIAWGVQRGLFAYALGDGEALAFDTIHYQEPLSVVDFAVIEGAWLLRPSLAERLLQPQEGPGDDPVDEPTGPPPDETPPPPDPTGPAAPPPPTPTTPRTHYSQVTIGTLLNWQQWYPTFRSY